MRVELIDETGFAEFDRHIIAPFNALVENINNVNIPISRETAEQWGMTRLLDRFEQLDRDLARVRTARERIAIGAEELEATSREAAISERSMERIHELANGVDRILNDFNTYIR